MRQDFPGSPVDKNLCANAGDTGSTPGLGKFRCASGQLTEAPRLLKPVRPTACDLQGEATLMRSW